MTADMMLFFHLAQIYRHEIFMDLGIVWLGSKAEKRLAVSFHDEPIAARPVVEGWNDCAL